ncbi:MBL fold metallo-hydrolase [Desulfopila aestuarii]|uniref:Metallo-beta-lactamase superfamily protein n=1 Tax=Desulfopila aestuarii DSM 18488 TaxID=1121416 RepID=A0A1M7XZ20_9BACT|nr:MBL fold metallo-hydrolase [Desulfopila aestuarii]SHO44129.1 Metallo-beta-lactamase superfamily protein [Desulfopila aestuarii DSM 18488]
MMNNFIFRIATCCMLYTMVCLGGSSFAEEPSPYNSGGLNIPEAVFLPAGARIPAVHVEPTEIFKDVYFIGTTSVGCMLYNTKDGIVMWDAMNNTDDMINILEPDMAALGLDPADIKLVMISHGHGDHYGGAKYIQDTYGAKVYMAQADEELMKWDRNGNPTQHPIIDKYLKDGHKISLKGNLGQKKGFTKGNKNGHSNGNQGNRADVVFDIIATPGHTAGSMSFAVPVTAFDGSEHVLVNWGGTGMPGSLEASYTYRDSVEKFAAFCEEKGADVELSMHPFVDYSTLKISQIREYGQSDPMVRGTDGVQFFMSALKAQVNQNITKFTADPNWDPRAETYETFGYGADILFVPNIIYTPPITALAIPGDHVEPLEIFKNVYYIGKTFVGCLLFKTEDGIIMWDALFPEDVTGDTAFFEEDMATLGLDPNDIKLIMISHGHGDHFGGAKYLQDTYGAEVMISAEDKGMMSMPGPGGLIAPPVIDGYLTDGGVVTFGGLTFEFAATPGHTPGSMSFVVPVTAFDGSEHKLANWGGTNYPKDIAGMLNYKNSVAYFSDFIAERNVDVEFSVHPFVDQSLLKLDKVRETGSSDAFIYGEESVQFFFDCLDYAVSQKIAEVE